MKKYTASEQLQAMTSQWADNKAIRIIGGIGLNKAIDVRKEIEHQVKNDGYRLPKHAVVPMEYVINYFQYFILNFFVLLFHIILFLLKQMHLMM